MTYFYKGVGVGTFLHATDLRTTGIAPARPTLSFSLSAAMLHVSSGVVMSPCISVTRSYAVAEDYARYAGLTAPTLAKPAHVYVIEIPDPLPTGIAIHDPVEYVASHNRNPLASPSYHHNGDAKFLLAVVDRRRILGALPRLRCGRPEWQAAYHQALLSPQSCIQWSIRYATLRS
jgi:hypothetical protein